MRLSMPNNSDQRQCPFCKELTAESQPQCQHCGLDMTAAHEPCEQCGRVIKSEAVVCRHCHFARSGWDESPRPKARKHSQAHDWSKAHDRSNHTMDSGQYGQGVRAQVFEVIVRQGMAGAPWRTICAGPMQVNNISSEEVDAEIRRRLDRLK